MLNRFSGFSFVLFIILFLAGCTPKTEPATDFEALVQQNSFPPAQFSVEQQEMKETLRETGILFWNQQQMRFGYRNTHHIGPVRYLHPAENPFPLPYADVLLESHDILYLFSNGARDLNYFLRETDVRGLIVLKNGQIILEHYAEGRTENDPWISFSVTKSLLSMLFGAAVQDGFIRSTDDLVTLYLPELEGSAYAGVTIEQLLHMASGVAWNEDYTDPDSDVARLEHISSATELVAFMAALPRAAAPGTRFTYSTGETNLAGVLLSRATGRSLTAYAQEKLWTSFGMEHPASWSLMGEDEIEHGGCCISASLRDYARIGHFALSNGQNTDGHAILPDGWMGRSVSALPANPGYGYFWWLMDDGRFAGSGIFGQHLHLNPEMNLVVAIQSTWPDATSSARSAHRRAFLDGVTQAARNLGGSSCCSEQ